MNNNNRNAQYSNSYSPNNYNPYINAVPGQPKNQDSLNHNNVNNYMARPY